jgi:hypothetical protein
MNRCKERAFRIGLSDEQFWILVFNPDGEPPPVDGDDEWYAPYDADWETEWNMPKQCGICNMAGGPCGYDPEGLPYIHADGANAFGNYGDIE